MLNNANQSTFTRSKHDKQNPYAMISREMLSDKSISPKAKGVLCYLLSLPNDWKIYHSHLTEALNVGKEYLNSAMDELLKAGYAKRSRVKKKGIYQPYSYEISEFKIFLPNGKTRSGEQIENNREEMPSQDSFNQSGFSAAENPHLLKNKANNKLASLQKKEKQLAKEDLEFLEKLDAHNEKYRDYLENSYRYAEPISNPYLTKDEMKSFLLEFDVKFVKATFSACLKANKFRKQKEVLNFFYTALKNNYLNSETGIR